jgi:hypothetical protein
MRCSLSYVLARLQKFENAWNLLCAPQFYYAGDWAWVGDGAPLARGTSDGSRTDQTADFAESPERG